MSEQVENLVQERKREAHRRGILFKAGEVAKLGIREPKRYGANYTFSRGDLDIWFDDYGNNASISFQNQKVFGAQLGNVNAYRPDIAGWEECLDAIFDSEIGPKDKREQTEAEERRKRELYDSWGIGKIPPDYDTWARWTRDVGEIRTLCDAAERAIEEKSIDDLEEALSTIENLVHAFEH